MAVAASAGRELSSSRIARPEVALEALCDIALTASEPVALDQLARRTVDIVRDLLRSDAGSLFLWRDRSARLEPVIANDRGWDVRAIRSFQPGQGVTGATYKLGRPLIIRDYAESPHAVDTAVAQGLKSGVAVPLKIGRRRVGVLSARSYRHLPWTQQDVRMLTLIASIVAPGLEAASSAARVSRLRLTPKETQVLADMMAGRSAKSIARASGLSEATVRTHIRSVLAKFGVNSQLAAVVLARDLGFDPMIGISANPASKPNGSSVLGIRPDRDLA
ncbi:MAG TPA: GAF domain-containing protein [Candidatus Dormibacteraeota bacterium]|nr:GAF domain-containing protein [Candidatus Dormibacteraeota bacterium]